MVAALNTTSHKDSLADFQILSDLSIRLECQLDLSIEHFIIR
jgi:hypothetical protein